MVGIRCEVLDRVPGAEYDELLGSSADHNIFLSRAWLDSWLEVFGHRHDVLFLAVREHQELIGLAPFVVSKPGQRGGLRRLAIAGQEPTAGEHLSVVAEVGRESEVADAVARALTTSLRRRWDVLTIQRMLAASAMVEPLRTALDRARCRASVIPTGESPYVELPPDPAELLTGRSKNFRGQVRQSRNRVERLGDVELRVVGQDIDLEAAFADLLLVHGKRWEDDTSFASEEKLVFHKKLAQRLLDRDELYLAVLFVDGKPIASRYDFVANGKVWCIQGGWDPDYSSARPGMFMTEQVLIWGIRRGLTEYDFLAGAGEYKQRWATATRDLVTVLATNPWSARGWAYRAATAARSRREGGADATD